MENPPKLDKNTQRIFARREKPEEIKTGGDSVFADEKETRTTTQMNHNGAFRTISIPQEELWATAKITGKGKFITTLAVKEAFRTTWKFVSRKGSQEPLSPETVKIIDETDKKWRLKKTFKSAVAVARAIGQCIIAIVHTNPFTKTGPLRLKIAPYNEMDVDFDDDGMPKMYHVYMKAGHNRMKVDVPAAECIALVNDEDPFENGTLGNSELLASYFPIRWMMNMLDGYSRIVLQRGLGMLDVTVEGADPIQLAAYETEFGDPTQYSTLFHDEKVKVVATAGISQGHNITETMKIYTREISSGCGIGENRLDGVQTYVTGAETDQDNYAAIGQTIQEEYMDSLLALYVLCNPRLKDVFFVEMPIEIKLDKMKEAQLRATEVGSIMQAPELFNVNYAMDLIGQPPPDGKEGKLSVAQFIASQHDFDEENPENFDDTITSPNSQNEKKGKATSDPDSQQSEVQNLEKNGMKSMSQQKKDRAKDLLTKDEGDALSLNKVRDIIKDEYGSSLSMSDLVSIRGEISAKKKEEEK